MTIDRRVIYRFAAVAMIGAVVLTAATSPKIIIAGVVAFQSIESVVRPRCAPGDPGLYAAGILQAGCPNAARR